MLNNTKILIGILIVIGALTYWVVQNSNDLEHQQTQPLIPEWQKNDELINEVDQIKLTQNGEELVLLKQNKGWQLNGGFYASIEPLFKLIQSLKSAKIIEAKTANPDKHEQLQLAENNLVVSLYQGSDLKQALHIGKRSTAGLTFVRRVGDEQTFTVNGLEPISFSVDSWAMKTILDVAANEIQMITIKPSEGELIQVTRGLENASFQLENIPEGYQLNATASLNQLANGLSRFMIDEAIPVESWPETIDEITEVPANLTATYQMTSGQTISMDVYQQEEDFVLTIESNEHPHYQGWFFKIPEYKYNALNRKMSEFIELIPAEVEESIDVDETETLGNAH